ncbi:hypothetical protein PMAC_001218 [Pneumocystis sp. 'macacae']|nr:hypothetical protein PMAC_001218 [Pneumocystis sp. 'macacae']
MSNLQADGRADCLFFMNNSCNKGDLCIYRHNLLARESKVQCTEFQARQTCSKVGCGDRHLTSYISGTYCYWETTPTGCTKAICPFKHHDQPGMISWKKTKKINKISLGIGKQFFFNNLSGKAQESIVNTSVGDLSQKEIPSESFSKIKQKNETVRLLNEPIVQKNENIKTCDLSTDPSEKRKRKHDSILPLFVSKKQEKSPLKDKTVKIVPQTVQNIESQVSVPTAPKSQRNMLQSKASIKGSKGNHNKKQDKRSTVNAHEKDNVEFRVRTLEEIREEKAAKLRQIEKNKGTLDDQKDGSLKGSLDVLQADGYSLKHSKIDMDEKKKVADYVKLESQTFSSQENLKLKNSQSDNLKNEISSILLPSSDDDLDFLNENEDKSMDVNIVQNGNNDFEDDELAAFERELEM